MVETKKTCRIYVILLFILFAINGCASFYAVYALQHNDYEFAKVIYEESPDLPKGCLETGKKYSSYERSVRLSPIAHLFVPKAQVNYVSRAMENGLYCPMDEAMSNGVCDLDRIRNLMELGFKPTGPMSMADYFAHSVYECNNDLVTYLADNLHPDDVAAVSRCVVIDNLLRSNSDLAVERGRYRIIFASSKHTRSRIFPEMNEIIFEVLLQKNKALCQEGKEANCQAAEHLTREKELLSSWQEKARETERQQENTETAKILEKDLAKLFPTTEDGMKYGACLCVEAEKQWKQEIAYQKQIEKEVGVSSKLILYKAGKNIVQIQEALKEFKKQYGKRHKKSLGLNACQKHIEKVQHELPESIYSAAHFCEFP